MRIYIGADHRGFHLKAIISEYLKSKGYELTDVGDNRIDPDDDYPQFAGKCAVAVLGSQDQDARGILICSSGQGMCISANRFKGIRAALGHNVEAARSSRNDDDTNVLCLPAELDKDNQWQDIVQAFIDTPFAAATRFIRRNKEMDELGL